MTLWLLRHAATLAAPGLCYGRLDVEADPAATREAAQALARVLPAAIQLHVSPARRCRQLADALAALRPDLAPARADARLQELDFGTWEGQPWDTIGQAAVTAWTDDFARHAPGGGESLEALFMRVASALEEQRTTQADAAWITHAGVIRAVRLLARGSGAPARASDWPSDDVPFGGWETVELGISAPAPVPASRA